MGETRDFEETKRLILKYAKQRRGTKPLNITDLDQLTRMVVRNECSFCDAINEIVLDSELYD